MDMHMMYLPQVFTSRNNSPKPNTDTSQKYPHRGKLYN